MLRVADRFCINIMAGHHAEITRHFARRGVDRFGAVAWTKRPAGPALRDAVGWIECSFREEHEAGDHSVVIARVLAIEAQPSAEPLVFFRGEYGTFTAGGRTRL
jgi:3-hydroxy-9,10-secoandrosta-1,3,5(10)-triene-9,17-dione monooxygenase reductase component